MPNCDGCGGPIGDNDCGIHSRDGKSFHPSCAGGKPIPESHNCDAAGCSSVSHNLDEPLEEKNCYGGTEYTPEEVARQMVFMRQEAARAWCEPTTDHKVMDPELCEEFAKILRKHSYAPRLGCATTGELIREIMARINMEYRTITGGRP